VRGDRREFYQKGKKTQKIFDLRFSIFDFNRGDRGGESKVKRQPGFAFGYAEARRKK
jgi:hypothetical protein